ncbi:MAG: amidohydrolase [Armatimonadetes bacterium]|jgi:imidazolonepropionase-like amidohydrolase|nr:amidohydrolase [Armatimonadota bacterium]
MKRSIPLAGLLAAALGALALPPSSQAAGEAVRAYTNARIIPIAGGPIEDGVLIVQSGRIRAVGRKGATPIPEGAEVHDCAGRTIMPGLVDTHSHVGGGSGADSSAPIQPDVRILDSINARDSGFQRVQAGGITTLNVMPGSGHLLGGQTLYLKARDGRTIDDLLIRDAEGKIAGGIKMANGTNPIRSAPFPGTRAKSAALVRAQYLKAQEYREKVRAANGDAAKLPPRDLGMEALVEVLDRKRVVHFHTHRADDITTALRLAAEFNFRIVLHHVTEGYRVAEEIARSGAPASIIVIDSPGGKLEAVNLDFGNGAALDKAGVPVGFHTDDWITDSRLFLRSAALAVRAGMPREKALEALTIAGARMLDLQSRVGSLEPGKDADFIVLTGDPFSVYTKVQETYVDGVKVFDRSNPHDRLFATGGYGAGRDQVAHLDCFDDLTEVGH